MLKKYALLAIIAFPLLFSCSEDPVAKAEKEATASSKEFFQWYLKNKKELLEKRKAIVFVDEGGFNAVNMFKIDDYVSFLKKSGKFSEDFIQKEKEYWLGECLDVIFEMQEKGVKGDPAVFPCKFNENPFYLTPKEFTQESISTMNFQSDSISLENASLKYGNHSLKLKNKNGSWKVMDWASK
ncbi:hypothetical protein [Aureivirga sp. CE67]|uniref:hypothetical protein n=1 Tax=Aureivirga sp. CE67 TaxID=1788983 RepID=UPI0018C8EE21|nr:hypothetical protein [Aureivirga sp. CE67]